MGFLEQLAGRYRDEGWVIFSKHLPGLAASPEGWKGPLPDLIARKGDQLMAVFVETDRRLADPLSPERWTQAAKNPGTSIRIFVHTQADLKLLQDLLRSWELAAEVGLVAKGPRRVRASRHRGNRIVRRALVVLLVAVISYLVLWLISLLYDYSPEFYEPRDFERESTISLMKLP